MGSALRQPRTSPRADTVGSLLRPAPLKQAVESFYAPGHSAVLAEDRAELRDLEDRAIRDAVRRQIDIGLDVGDGR
jgi:methionine synthase II (cobalamin-independent)